jgi:hypothetical protein
LDRKSHSAAVDWASTAADLMIEATQLIVSLGIAGAYRTVDITDALLTQQVLGHGYFRVFALPYLAMTKCSGTSIELLTSYLYDISTRVWSLGKSPNDTLRF